MSAIYKTLFAYKSFVAAGYANRYAHFHSVTHHELTDIPMVTVLGDTKSGGVAVDARAYFAGFHSNADFVARIGHRSLSGSSLGRNIGESASRKLDCMCMVYIE